MATHTSTNDYSGRTFFIGRENGQQDKNGRPYFFEWLSELPQDRGRRKFETRTSESGQRHYELFTALDGYLTGIDIEVKSFDATRQNDRWLILYLSDTPEEYKVEVGRIDSRYSMDIMKRLLHGEFDPNQKLRIAPYSLEKENGGHNIGLSAMSGTDAKLTASYKDPHLAGMPQPETREWKGRVEYDFSGVAEWLYEQVQEKVAKNLLVDPLASGPKQPAEMPDRINTLNARPIITHEHFTNPAIMGEIKEMLEPVQNVPEDDLPF